MKACARKCTRATCKCGFFDAPGTGGTEQVPLRDSLRAAARRAREITARPIEDMIRRDISEALARAADANLMRTVIPVAPDLRAHYHAEDEPITASGADYASADPLTQPQAELRVVGPAHSAPMPMRDFTVRVTDTGVVDAYTIGRREPMQIQARPPLIEAEFTLSGLQPIRPGQLLALTMPPGAVRTFLVTEAAQEVAADTIPTTSVRAVQVEARADPLEPPPQTPPVLGPARRSPPSRRRRRRR